MVTWQAMFTALQKRMPLLHQRDMLCRSESIWKADQSVPMPSEIPPVR